MANATYNILDTRDKTEITDMIATKANEKHTHIIDDVSNLQEELDSKSNVSHTHTIENITDLQDIIDKKSDISHTHVVKDITDLQQLLDDKANAEHTHEISDVNGLEEAVNMVKNGVYTLKDGEAIPQSSNLDDMKTVGNYVCGSDEDATTITNCPSGGQAFMLKVGDLLNDGTCQYQEIIRYSDGASWRRTFNSTSSIWNNWYSTSFATSRKQLYSGVWSAGSLEVSGIQDYTAYVFYANTGSIMIGFMSYDKTRINCYGIICPERNVMRLESATLNVSGNTLTRDMPRSWTVTGTEITTADGALVITRIEGLF